MARRFWVLEVQEIGLYSYVRVSIIHYWLLWGGGGVIQSGWPSFPSGGQVGHVLVSKLEYSPTFTE